MIFYGIDFTSAPRRKKPITVARCSLSGEELSLEEVEAFTSLEEFTGLLHRDGPWAAGMDFPFGLPREFVEAMGWPWDWSRYVALIADMTFTEFEAHVARFRESRSPGLKHPLRAADRLANSISPLMLVGVPVGRMFFRGAPLLLTAELNVVPCRPGMPDRTAFEAYPALLARRVIGKTPYKNDTPAKQTGAQREARLAVLRGLKDAALRRLYGVSVTLSKTHRESLVEDPTGDRLDALVCAIQAVWAYRRRRQGYGVPIGADPPAGWIADPELGGL